MSVPSRQDLERRLEDFVERHGPWVHHNIHLGHGVYTIGSGISGQEVRLPSVLQVASDLLPGPNEDLRVLDVGCHEGLFAVEFALRGASVVAVEGRRQHVEKVRFVRDVLALDNLGVQQADVRKLRSEELGRFDLVLCLGVLYHLDAPEGFEFAKTMGRLCGGLAIVDTHFSGARRRRYDFDGAELWGSHVREHDPSSDQSERDLAHGSSLGATESFWLTRPSLFNLLRRCGFSSIYEVRVPPPPYGGWDRVVLACVKGVAERPLTAPEVGADLDWPEREKWRLSRRRVAAARRAAAAVVPAGLRRRYRARRRRRQLGSAADRAG